MSGFKTLTSIACPLDQANVDTDQIIPKQFLTGVTRKGYGVHLFHDWRYLDLHEAEPNPDFVLNMPQYAGAKILLTRENFGCGSSREHAPWALKDFGFSVVLATSFADIFYGNAINNGMVPVRLTATEIDALFALVQADASTTLTIDLEAQTVSCGDKTFGFDIAAHSKRNLLLGLDMIGNTLELDASISDFERNLPAWV